MSHQIRVVRRLNDTVRRYVAVLLGENLAEQSHEFIEEVVLDSCAGAHDHDDSFENAVQRIMVLRRATAYMGRHLAAFAESNWFYGDAPANHSLVRFVLAQLTSPLEELPTVDSVLAGKCSKGDSNENLKLSILRSVDPSTWASDLWVLRGCASGHIGKDTSHLLFFADVGSPSELGEAQNIILLIELLGEKQGQMERFSQSQGITIEGYVRRACRCLRFATKGRVGDAVEPMPGPAKGMTHQT